MVPTNGSNGPEPSGGRGNDGEGPHPTFLHATDYGAAWECTERSLRRFLSDPGRKWSG